MITEFSGQYRFLSNLYPVVVELDRCRYPTVEHAYQAAKTLNQKQRAQILICGSPATAKRLGKFITIRPDWEQVKLAVMFELLVQKFNVPALQERILATGNHELFEGNNWGDGFWGCHHTTLEGHNWLGRLLMLVRSLLRLMP